MHVSRAVNLLAVDFKAANGADKSQQELAPVNQQSVDSEEYMKYANS